MPADRLPWGYFDTSVLVKFYVEESGTAEALALLNLYSVLSSVLAPIELASALRRHYTGGQMTDRELKWISGKILQERPFWTLIELYAPVLKQAEDLTRTVPVKTLDALHLASAVTFQNELGLLVPFITADDQQRKASLRLRLDIIFVE